jgi:hypothetical protein
VKATNNPVNLKSTNLLTWKGETETATFGCQGQRGIMEFNWHHAGKRAADEKVKIRKQLAQRGALQKARLCWTHRLTDAVLAQSWK